MSQPRLSYEDSCRRLQGSYLEEGSIPPLKNHLPQEDDEEPLGVSFFRTFVGEGDDLSNLTLPRTFFGRSQINNALFRNTDFTGSNFCWNDFTLVDFTEAVLARSDLRGSIFHKVKFVRSDLRGADLRRSDFKDCDFDGALMEGTAMTQMQGASLQLSDQQRREIRWLDAGPEPAGG